MKPSRQVLFRKLQALYERMEAAYDEVAQALGHDCAGCPKNCCASYFQHHTYLEWSYLLSCLKVLPAAAQAEVRERAQAYVDAAAAARNFGRTPEAMCPLCLAGRCIVHPQRLMICRLHGVPNVLLQPSGRQLAFPGCWRCQELVQGREGQLPVLDRTAFYRELAALEMAFLGNKARTLPRADLTLAEMILAGPPPV